MRRNDDPVRAEQERRKRNIVLALVLAGVAILVFLNSLVQWNTH